VERNQSKTFIDSVTSVGSAKFDGLMGDARLNRPIVAMAAS